MHSIHDFNFLNDTVNEYDVVSQSRSLICPDWTFYLSVSWFIEFSREVGVKLAYTYKYSAINLKDITSFSRPTCHKRAWGNSVFHRGSPGAPRGKGAQKFREEDVRPKQTLKKNIGRKVVQETISQYCLMTLHIRSYINNI